MNRNVAWIVLCCFLTLLLVISGINKSKNNRYEDTLTENEFFMMNIHCIPEIVQNFENVKSIYGRPNTLFFRCGSTLNWNDDNNLLDELTALQEEIGKERVWIFPAYPNDRNTRIRLRQELANFNHRNVPVDSLLIPVYDGEEKSYFAWVNNDGEIDIVFLSGKNKFQHANKFFMEVKKLLQAIESEKEGSVIQNESNEQE